MRGGGEPAVVPMTTARRLRWRRLVARALAAALVVAGVLAALTFFYFWRSPDPYAGALPKAPGEDRIVPAAEYQEGHPEPYVSRGQAALVFGSRHTDDPDDPQLQQIDREWEGFDPTVALVEGRLGFLAPGLMDPVKRYGEVGRVFALARRDDVRTYTWEPDDARLAELLVEEHPRERVALFLVLRPYFSSLRHGRPSSPERAVAPFLDRADLPALDGSFESVEDIDRLWKRDFANQPDWRDVSDERPLPGYLSAIADDANDARNRYLLRVIHALTQRGERVFVIGGSSHAVSLEPAMTAAARVPTR